MRSRRTRSGAAIDARTTPSNTERSGAEVTGRDTAVQEMGGATATARTDADRQDAARPLPDRSRMFTSCLSAAGSS